jgi:PKD repeat protein
MIKTILICGTMLSGVVIATAQSGVNQAANKLIKQPEARTLYSKSSRPMGNDVYSGVHSQGVIPCYTDQATEYYFKQHPEARAQYEAAQKEMGCWNNEYYSNQGYRTVGNQNSVLSAAPAPLDTIPVVFHILHQNGPENVSNQVIYDALAQINIDYQKMDPDTALINAHFQARATACNLVFKLATIDPNGNCTNGIIRHYDSNTNWVQTSPAYSYSGTAAGKWNPTKYMNIYIVKSISDGSGNSGGGIIVGYTYTPGTISTGGAADAIVYNYGWLGAANKDCRSLAHEMGHWLGLKHTFGNTNNPGVSCGDDNLGVISGQPIDDTPKTVGFFSTCPPQTPNSCDTSNWANVENIMDYSSCPKMFTLGQCKRMRQTLLGTTNGRNNLVTSANKIATGVRVPQVCAPIADFSADKHTFCAGTVVTFSDSTTNSMITGYQWDFPGGSPATSTAANPVITYPTAGQYPVTYTATNSAGSNTITKTAYINVGNTTADVQSGFIEGFETITVPNADWTINNSNGGPGWTQTTTAASTGTNSMMIDNYNNPAGSVEVLYTPSYNIQGINAATPTVAFTFKLAYQRLTTSASEKLQVFSSINCGQSWTQRYAKSGSSLATVAAANVNPYVPASASEWRTETVSIGALSAQQNVSFKFVFTSDANGNSNNIYIDDINISNTAVGIAAVAESTLNMNVFPNPSNGNVHVAFSLNEKQAVKLELVDMLGRTLETAVNASLPNGSYEYSFGNAQKLSSGIYFSKLTVDGKVYTKKVIVE